MPSRYARLDASARLARAPEGKNRREQTTSSARRGATTDVRCADCYELNGKPYKELVKIAHPPINCRRNPL